MSKRPHGQERDYRPAKRAKPDQAQKPSPVEEIQFARQLQQLLAFRQDGLQQLRHGIASFKAFLESIIYHKAEDDRARQLSILREYLENEKPADPNDSERPFLQQLWQAWSFANQNNIDNLSSSVSAILALLIRTLSSLLDFRDIGLLLCRTALQIQHLRLLKRCLEAPKHKDFLISPCLRLLIEITSFDGGILAREVYKRREQTLETVTLRRNLGLVKTNISEEEMQRRPSIRTWTARYILTLVRYLHEGHLVDLLKSRPLCTSLFQHLKHDPADLIQELLSTIEQHVLKNDELPKSAKASVLVQPNLERVVEIATRSREEHAAAGKAFAWLKAVCSKPSYGLLRTSGWYPPGTSSAGRAGVGDDIIDLGLDSVEFYDRDSRPDVRNTTILSWIQTLRPHSNLQERELLITCFFSAPELVAAYFDEKTLQLEPKLSNTWVGYASLLFEVVALPIPDHLGNENEWAPMPPQTKIVIENILPQPLTQKVLTRCLNQSSDLITFFAVRILVMAFEKLAKILSQLSKATATSEERPELWHEASEKLLVRFNERCPKMKDVIAAFRKTPDDEEHVLQRESMTRLLRLYYEVTPLQALEEQFDISSLLAAASLRSQSNDAASEIEEVRALELEHLLHIAQDSPGMHWFTKQGSLNVSPIVTVILMHSKDLLNRQIRELVRHVLSESYIFNGGQACDVLLASLNGKEDNILHEIAPYLDDWLSRIAHKPVKYLDDLEGLALQSQLDHGAEDQVSKMPSLFVAVLLEQAPYVLAKKSVVKWINEYFHILIHTNERSQLLETVYKFINDLDGWETDVFSEGQMKDSLHATQKEESKEGEPAEATTVTDIKVVIPFSPPPTESENHPELLAWGKKDIEMALEDGDIKALILCLSSQYPEIRAQAHAQLRKFLVAIQNSDSKDKDSVHLLVGELVETYEQQVLPTSDALPYLAGTFASNALPVQMDPTHDLHPKMNRYLLKGPEWRVNKLPVHWVKNTIHSVPYEDDAYWTEVHWVLNWLADGLRTAADLEILRRGNVLEEVMCLYGSPGAAVRKEVREKVLELLWRASFVEGGSTTMITRTGVLSFLDMIKKDDNEVEHALKRRILETCDRERIEEWSGRMLDSL